ncbi:trypsin-like peptidase domain-containing protein [Polyangium sorediatum]|uniref:Trypsin-like peptidase domain-containing protein n=1 Tax=Polyangium sorediatum TaxID=889274 RepID=A0ABT6P2R6_9BACT|nr:trypsin-like peptidase domain-containing protein [Polyangium sorediatum]MDI1434901.1 trypsin-like peptidase domain-containing protein [Polyangium sorediatum]
MVAPSPQPAVEAAIWLAFAPGGGHFTAVAVGPHHLLTVARVSESAPHVKLLRAGEQVRTAEVVQVLPTEEGDLAVLRCAEELPHVLRLMPADEFSDFDLDTPVTLVGFRDSVENALAKRAVVLHWSSVSLIAGEPEEPAPRKSQPDTLPPLPRLLQVVHENEAGGPILDSRQRLVGIAARLDGEGGVEGLVTTIDRFYERNRKWKIPLGPPAPRVAKAPTMAQSLALMHLVAAQHEEHEGSNPAALVEHYRAALRLDASSGAAHLGLACAKSVAGELDEDVFHSIGRACELLPASEWSSECADARLANLLRSSKHLHGVVMALRADLKKGRSLAEWAALGRAVADLVHSPDAEESGRPRPPEKAAGRLLLWAGQPRSVISIPSREQPDILRAAAFLLVDHAEQALFWLDDPQEDEEVESSRMETTQQLVLALRWIARCREGTYDGLLSREVAEKHGALLGKLMPGGDVFSWHAHALAKAHHGEVESGMEDLDRAMRLLSPMALPGRWSREFPGLLPTPAQLAAAFGRVVLEQGKAERARKVLEKLPMPASDDAHAAELASVEKKLRGLAGVGTDVEVSPDRALLKASREDPRAVRLARVLAFFAEADVPRERLGDLSDALPVLLKLGFLRDEADVVSYDATFRTRVRDLLTPDQRTAALHEALDLLLMAYLDANARERTELWPHIQETTKTAMEHEVELVPAAEILARVGNQRARELSYAEARDLLEKAHDLGSRGAAPADLCAEIDMDLGWVEVLSGTTPRSQERLERALNFYNEMAMTSTGATPHRRMARIHYSLARLAVSKSDRDAAYMNACRALEEAERGFEPGTRKAVQIYTSLAHLFIDLGDHLRARKATARISPRERETRTDLAFDS